MFTSYVETSTSATSGEGEQGEGDPQQLLVLEDVAEELTQGLLAPGVSEEYVPFVGCQGDQRETRATTSAEESSSETSTVDRLLKVC